MINLPGVIFSLLSAASFGCTNAATRRSVLSASATLAMYASTFVGFPLFLLVAVGTGELFQAGRVPLDGYLWLGASGIVHFILGRYCNYRAIGAIGSNRSQPVSATNLLFTVALSVLFLGERPQMHTLVGTVLIMVGPLLGLRDRKRTAPAPVAATPGSVAVMPKAAPPVRLLEGYLFGLLAAACYGSSPALVRFGLGSTGLPVLGATVSVGASLLVLGATLLRPGQVGFVLGNVNFGDGMRRKEGEWYDTPLNWLLLGSVTIASAQLFRYLALGAMDVTVASPLIASNAVFTLLFGWFMNRQNESFSKNVIMGVVMSMIGSVVLVLPIGV